MKKTIYAVLTYIKNKKDLRILTQLQKRYPQFKIGRCTYGKPKIFFMGDACKLEIGSYCSISDNVTTLLGLDHQTEFVTTHPLSNLHHFGKYPIPQRIGDIIIGNDCWIGYGATILSGVTIGDGAVIGAQTVVSKSVAPYAIVVGNPAREIKKRFSDDVIERLLKVKWWCLDDAVIESITPLLLSNDVRGLLDHLEMMKAVD